MTWNSGPMNRRSEPPHLPTVGDLFRKTGLEGEVTLLSVTEVYVLDADEGEVAIHLKPLPPVEYALREDITADKLIGELLQKEKPEADD